MTSASTKYEKCNPVQNEGQIKTAKIPTVNYVPQSRRIWQHFLMFAVVHPLIWTDRFFCTDLEYRSSVSLLL